MANSANYLLSKMSINMTILELSVRDQQKTLMLQIELSKKVEGHPDQQDKIVPLKERFIKNLQIHLADADTQLERVQRLWDTLPTPEEFAKVSGDHLVKKGFVLQLWFGALGTYMGTLTDKKYERLQQSLTAFHTELKIDKTSSSKNCHAIDQNWKNNSKQSVKLLNNNWKNHDKKSTQNTTKRKHFTHAMNYNDI